MSCGILSPISLWKVGPINLISDDLGKNDKWFNFSFALCENHLSALERKVINRLYREIDGRANAIASLNFKCRAHDLMFEEFVEDTLNAD